MRAEGEEKYEGNDSSAHLREAQNESKKRPRRTWARFGALVDIVQARAHGPRPLRPAEERSALELSKLRFF
jgi:hypothetical protein